MHLGSVVCFDDVRTKSQAACFTLDLQCLEVRRLSPRSFPGAVRCKMVASSSWEKTYWDHRCFAEFVAPQSDFDLV